MKKLACLSLCIIHLGFCFGQDSYEETNRQERHNPSTFHATALTFLEGAKNKLIEQNWDAAHALSTTALIYDSSIADLYYIQAISLFESGALPYSIIKPLEASLDKNVLWYQYTEDSAQLLLARMYVLTKRAQDALTLLDTNAYLNNSDAILIKASAYYALKDFENARNFVFEGANQYPYDRRFDELFYTQEYQNYPLIDELSIFFNERSEQFSRDNPLLLLYSAIFEQDSEEKNRLLKAWNIQGEKHPLYAIHALTEGLIQENDAFDYMLNFIDELDYSTLIHFMSMLTDEDVIERAQDYFTNYNGIVYFDFDGDRTPCLSVQYEKGRPSLIQYDENQDGLLSWEMTNDYGEPKTIEFFEEKMFVEYGAWPYVKNVIDNSKSMDAYTYYLVSNALSLPVIEFSVADVFQNNLSLTFYTPLVLEHQNVSTMELFNASYLIDYKTNEYENSRSRLTVLDGTAKSAVFTDNEMPYAYAYFLNGIPISRNIDKDRNGSYEVIELYGQSDVEGFDSKKLEQEVFGFEHLAKGQFIQKVLVDVNNDGFDDFSEEYFSNQKRAFWDSNSDGNWDVQYIETEENNSQEVVYVHPLTKEIKSVLIESGIPILAGEKNVVMDSNVDFFWIGENAGSMHAEKIITELSLQNSAIALMVTDLLWDSEKEQFMRIVGIKSGEMYFGEVFYE